MDQLTEIVQLLRSIDAKLGQLLDPPCHCGHLAAQHSSPADGVHGVCLAKISEPPDVFTCGCDQFRRTVGTVPRG